MNFTQTIIELKHIFVKKDEEIEKLKKELLEKNEEIKKLKEIYNIPPEKNQLKTLNDHILHVCKDGEQRTVKEIFDQINNMEIKPWSKEAKTPCSSCSAACGKLFKNDKIYKTNDTPTKYFVLL